MCYAVIRLAQVQFFKHGRKQIPVLGPVNAFRTCTDDGNPCFLKVCGKVQRGLAAELDNHAKGVFLFNDVEHIFSGQRFKVELVGCVIVGGDRFRVRVDHDGFDPLFP